MSFSQPQLLQIALDQKDVVYTPDWVARDMVNFFQPSGRILEPCAGDGVFLKYLPTADWCEIEKGRDFFSCASQYDWIIGNPPYKQFKQFISHSYQLAENILFLIPSDKPFNSTPNMKIIYRFGGISHMRYYGEVFNEIHRPMSAFHFRRDYRGPMHASFYEVKP